MGMGELQGEELSVSSGPNGSGPSSWPGKGVWGLGCSKYSRHPPRGMIAGEYCAFTELTTETSAPERPAPVLHVALRLAQVGTRPPPPYCTYNEYQLGTRVNGHLRPTPCSGPVTESRTGNSKFNSQFGFLLYSKLCILMDFYLIKGKVNQSHD